MATKRSLIIGNGWLLYLLVIFAGIALGYVFNTKGYIHSLDLSLFYLIYDHRSVWLDRISLPFDKSLPDIFIITIPLYQVPLALLVSIYVWFKYRPVFWQYIIAMFLGVVFSYAFFELIWYLFPRERPFTAIPNLPDYLHIWGQRPFSYPSGHALQTMAFAAIMGAFAPTLKVALFILAVVVGYTRIYLGVHYPSDVIVGLVLGYLLGIAVVKIVLQHRPNPEVDTTSAKP